MEDWSHIKYEFFTNLMFLGADNMLSNGWNTTPTINDFFGKTKYGADRFIKGFLDLVTLSFIQRFGKRPMHFFGLIGTIMILTGLIISIYIGYDKLFVNKTGRLITERPLFYISLVTMLMGLIFFIAGFLGELILRSKTDYDNYSIVEKTK